MLGQHGHLATMLVPHSCLYNSSLSRRGPEAGTSGQMHGPPASRLLAPRQLHSRAPSMTVGVQRSPQTGFVNSANGLALSLRTAEAVQQRTVSVTTTNTAWVDEPYVALPSTKVLKINVDLLLVSPRCRFSSSQCTLCGVGRIRWGPSVGPVGPCTHLGPDARSGNAVSGVSKLP